MATVMHGTRAGYRTGCRCGKCVEANRKYHREYRRNRRGPTAKTARPTVTKGRPRSNTSPVMVSQPTMSERLKEPVMGPDEDTSQPSPADMPSEELLNAANDVQPDPEPPESVRDSYNMPGEGVIFTVTKAVAMDVQGKLAFFLGMITSTWEMMDPTCGAVASARADLIAKKMTPLICRSPQLVEFFTARGGGFMEWLDFGIAIWPVLETVYAHHLGKSRGQKPTVDATAPPDYSQYPSAPAQQKFDDNLTPPFRMPVG